MHFLKSLMIEIHGELNSHCAIILLLRHFFRMVCVSTVYISGFNALKGMESFKL